MIDDFGALGRGGEAPGLPGFGGGADGVIDIGGGGGLEFADDVVGVGRIDVQEGLAGAGGDPLTADEVFVELYWHGNLLETKQLRISKNLSVTKRAV